MTKAESRQRRTVPGTRLPAWRRSTARRFVRRAWRSFASRDPESISACFDPDARWTAPARNATALALGVASDMVGREAIVRFLTVDFHRIFVKDVSIEFRGFFGGGDNVTVEETMHATLPDGRRYTNDYCFVFELRNGMIHRVREYMDTARGLRMIFAETEADAPAHALRHLRANDPDTDARHRRSADALSCR